jgi:hypothetical protein
MSAASASTASTASFARQGIVSRKAGRQHGAQRDREGFRSHRFYLLVVVRVVEGRTRDRENAWIDLRFSIVAARADRRG